jgi:uncharacterized protein YjiK
MRDIPREVCQRYVPAFFYVAMVVAGVVGAGSCGRSELSSDNPVAPMVQSLQLISTHSMDITEPSGLAYSSKTRQLYMVSDNRSAIFVIDTTGRVLSSIPVTGQDFEGITLSANADTFFVAEETLSQITSYLPNGSKIASFPINVRTETKHGPEGVTTYNSGHLLVINEKVPMMLLEYAGTTEVRRATLSYTTDISDICYDAASDAFWIVSDESQMVIKISRSGALLGQWSTTVNQGEGIAFIGNKMYIVSDTDAKLYVFQKPA